MNPGQRDSERRCIATRQSLPKQAMLRFVRDPDNRLVFDVKGNLPGRGVWITAARPHLRRALGKGLFERAFKGAVSVPAGMLDTVEGQLRQAALGSLGMARKAGLVLTGFHSVEGAIRAGKVIAVLHARDGAEDGRRKLGNAIHGLEESRRPVMVATIFTANELSLALGGANVIHAAAMDGLASEAFVKKAQRLAGFVAADADDRTGADGSAAGDGLHAITA